MIVLFNRVEVAKSIFDIVDDWNKLFSLIISIKNKNRRSTRIFI